MRAVASGALIAGVVLCAAASLSAASAQQVDASGDFSSLSLEQLGNVEITSVSKRPEPLSGAAAAVFVITAEDIRRSGASSLPEVLRLAPNLEVARMNAFEYTITARGFNSTESANKLLVLIDGRSVYSPLASTVFWQNIDVPLSTIDRIEVVSGPGGTLYGANAVNGVISIITKNSAKTQGLLVSAGAGPDDQSATARYGASLGGNATLQVNLTTFNRANTDAFSASDTTKDDWQGTQGGFRFDDADGADTYLLEGNLYGNQSREYFYEKGWGENLTGNWTHAFENSSLNIAAYYDNTTRTEPVAKDETTTYDLSAQDTTSLGWGDSFVWGGEYRLWREAFYSDVAFAFAKPAATITLGNIFAQDELPIADNLKLTLGLKAEDNSYSGLDLLPNIRLAWQVSPDALIWAAASRAVRTPSKIDRELEDPGFLLPAPDFKSEKLTAYELGYRGELGGKVSLSASMFFNHYDDLRSDQYTPVTVVPIMLANGLAGNTYGAEAWGSVTLTDWWRLSAGANWLHKDFHLRPGFNDLAEGQSLGQDPDWQAQLKSQMNIASDWEADVMLRYVGRVTQDAEGTFIPLVPSYFEADARLGWHVTDTLELSLAGYNLLHGKHLEVNDPSTYPVRYIDRSFFVNLSKSF
jgi:iron complex outermembrane receptor protein